MAPLSPTAALSNGRIEENVGLLATCQALLLVNNSVLITVNALAGYALATNKSIATLPVTAYFLAPPFPPSRCRCS